MYFVGHVVDRWKKRLLLCVVCIFKDNHGAVFAFLCKQKVHFFLSVEKSKQTMTTTTSTPYASTFKVQSDKVQYTDKQIIAQYDYQTTQIVQQDAQTLVVKPVTRRYVFKTERKVPKLGVMLVGWGGNNGTTFTGIIYIIFLYFF